MRLFVMSQNAEWLLYVFELLNLFENRSFFQETKMLITSQRKKIFQFRKEIDVS